MTKPFFIAVITGVVAFLLCGMYRQARSYKTLLKEKADLQDALANAERMRDALVGKEGDLTHTISDLRDIKSATLNILEDLERERDHSEQETRKLGVILQSIGEGIFVVDTASRVLIFNDAASILSGFFKDEVVGKPYQSVLRFVYEETGLPYSAAIKTAFVGGAVHEIAGKTALLRKDGTRMPVVVGAAPLRDAAGGLTGVVVVFRDVTKEREIERQKSDFVSFASHQLKSPLTGIRLYTEMLISGQSGPLTDAQRDTLSAIYQGSERMLSLIKALLDISRIERGMIGAERDIIVIPHIIEKALEDLAPNVNEKKLKVATDYDTSLPAVMENQKFMEMVFQNLLSNAVKYTPSGGSITVKIRKVKDEIIASVSDTGCGIPREDQAHIFGRFFRARNVVDKSAIEGMGLGLYIVKEFIENIGGRIWFESTEGKGTTFYVAWPIRVALQTVPTGGKK